MANKHKESCLTSLVVREIQMKTAVRYQLILTRMAIIKNTENNKCLQGCEKLEPYTLMVGK